MKQKQESEAIQHLAASKLFACIFNPRKRRNAAADKELHDSIEHRGIIQPIIARPVGKMFEIGAGHRRWEQAISIGGKDTPVPVIVRELDEESFRDLVMIENLQRDDLHPLDEAEGYQQLMVDKQLDVEGLAGLVNKKAGEIMAALQLLKLSDKSKEMFDAGKFDAAFARQLARLQPADQAEGLKEAKRDTGYSIHALKDFINRHVALELAKAPFDTESADLLPIAGACTVCPKRSGANQLLFGDVKSKDICFDPKCFQQKCDVFLAGIEGQLERNGKPFVRVSGWYRSNKKHLIGTEEYRKLTRDMKDCPSTMLGVMHEAQHHEGKLGDVIRICRDTKCKVHADRFGREKTQRSPAEQRKTRIQNLTAKRDLIIRQETLNAVLADIRKRGAGFEDLKIAVRSYFSRYWHDAKREYFKRKGVEAIKHTSGGRDFEATFEKHVLAQAKTVPEIQAILVDLALHFEIEGRPFGKKTSELETFAERHDIDVALIRRAVTKEFAGKLSKLKQGQATPKAKPAGKKKARKKPKPAKTPR